MRRGIIGLFILLFVAGFSIAVGEITDGGAGELIRFGIFSGEVSTEGGVRIGRGVTPFRVESTPDSGSVRAGYWAIAATSTPTPTPTATATATPTATPTTADSSVYIPIVIR